MHLFTGMPKHENLKVAIKYCSMKNVTGIPEEVEKHQKVLGAVKGTVLENSKNFVCLILQHYFLFSRNHLYLTFFFFFLLHVFQFSHDVSINVYNAYVWHAKKKNINNDHKDVKHFKTKNNQY